MKALLIKFESEQNQTLLAERECLYYSTALDSLSSDIIKDTATDIYKKFEPENIEKIKEQLVLNSREFTDRTEIARILYLVGLGELFNNKLNNGIYAIITISVTRYNIQNQYYIICSRDSCIDSISTVICVDSISTVIKES